MLKETFLSLHKIANYQTVVIILPGCVYLILNTGSFNLHSYNIIPLVVLVMVLESQSIRKVRFTFAHTIIPAFSSVNLLYS